MIAMVAMNSTPHKRDRVRKERKVLHLVRGRCYASLFREKCSLYAREFRSDTISEGSIVHDYFTWMACLWCVYLYGS